MKGKGTLSVLILTSVLLFTDTWAACGEIPIDNFEDGDISDWIVPYSPSKTNLTLTTNAASGSYAVNSSADSVDWGWNDFTKENLDLDLPQPVSYYNLSFWYYVPEGVQIGGEKGEWFIYIGYNGSLHTGAPYIGPTQEFKPNDTINEYGHWAQFSMAIDENFNNPTYRFDTYDRNYIKSVYFLPQPREDGVFQLFDDIKLIPKVPIYEDWVCTDWGACSDGIQTRSCVDRNNCGTVGNKPATARACISLSIVPDVSVDGNLLLIRSIVSSTNGVDWVRAEITLPNGTTVTRTMSRVSGTVLSGTYETLFESSSCGIHSVKVVADDGVDMDHITRNVDVSQTLEVTMETNKAIYQRTETIRITGTVSDASDITLTIQDTTHVENDTTSFAYNYTIPQIDPTGGWDIILHAVGRCNSTSVTKKIQVVEAQTFETYNIIFTSPAAGSPYQRGETVSTTVRVEENSQPVSGAEVFTYIGDERLNLSETISGTYHLDYQLSYSAPLGTLPISIRATKVDRGGAKTVEVYIQPATINLELSPINRVVVGAQTTVGVTAIYPDGSSASGLSLKLSVPDGTISMDEVSPGRYEASYIPSSAGVWNLEVSGSDANANIGSETETVQIYETSLLDILTQYWYLVVVAVLIACLASYPLIKRRMATSRYEGLRKQGLKIMEMQKELQESYFQAGEIDMETFKEKSAEYERRLTQIREEIEGLEPKG